MFRHKGKRTFRHNLRLASNLSLVAGIVNSVGILAISTLTTNVTGHFAYFTENLIFRKYSIAFQFIIYILFFLLGAFISNTLVEIALLKKQRYIHASPLILEILILAFVGLCYVNPENEAAVNQMAYLLLVAMGLQNALVTKISKSVVRTTHLTGLFTDLGIELSQLFFYNSHPDIIKVKKSIFLKLSIILFFFIGCICGGLAYLFFNTMALLAAAFLLLIALLMDSAVVLYNFTKQKIHSRK